MSRAEVPLLKAADVAKRLNVSVSQVYTLAREGRLPVVSIGGAVRFRAEDITAAAKARRNPKPKPKPIVQGPAPRVRARPIRAEVRALMRPDLCA